MKIYLSYSHHDKDLAYKFKSYLTEQGFETIWDENLLTIGDDFNHKIKKALSEADIYLPLISENFQNSNFTQDELQTAIGYANINNYPVIFPYIIEGNQIPMNIANLLCLVGTSDINSDLLKITYELNKIKGTIFAQQDINEKRVSRIEISLDSYLTDVFRKPERNELKDQLLAYFCYILSIAFLIAIIPFILRINLSYLHELDIIDTIVYSVKNIVGLSVLAALSRLAFILGKSFMVEAIRNGDRIHAISFGRFFIQAYGREATRQEIREVLGDWNIDKGSSFQTQDAKEIDPNIYGALDSLKSYFNKN